MLVEREGTNEYFNSGVEYFTLKNCFTELLSSKQKKKKKSIKWRDCWSLILWVYSPKMKGKKA